MREADVNRSVYYYDLCVSMKNESSGLYEERKEPVDAFFLELFKVQEQASDNSAFLKKTKNGDDFFVIVDTVEEECVEFRIVLCRTDALPFIERDGKLDKLGDYIEEDQNIAEITHCVYFRKYGVMGAEFNFSGARPSAIAEYIMVRKPEMGFVCCRAKLSFDAYSRLLKDKEFTLFDFAVKTNSDAYNNVLANKSIFSAIQATVPESDTMEIVLKKRKTKKNNHTGFSLPLGDDEIKELLSKYRDDIGKFRVSQFAISDPVDLLSDKLVHKVSLIKTEERTIDSLSMYGAIKGYFNSTVKTYCED